MKSITSIKLITLTSIFFLLADNYAFFQNTLKVYPLDAHHIGFLASLGVVLVAFTLFIFTLVSSRWTTKPLLILVLIISSLANYFMNTYHIVIDDTMIRNILQTDIKESLDLFSLKQLSYLIFLGLLPTYIVYKTPLKYRGFRTELIAKLKTLLITLVIIVASIFLFSQFYTSFAREHKPLRYSVNPLYWIYSSGKYISKTFESAPKPLQKLGTDATITPHSPHKLVILVVGEATRADHFSLNGYEKETNPLLKQEAIINFSQMYSCGTATATSVPCMFSIYPRKTYSYKKGRSTENVLDVLRHTDKVAILWRDNNSDSKGVALRVPYENYKSNKNNTICTEGECRDIGMLVGLDTFIQTHKDKDILIVLHQMGNHGPAYYKRYTKSFERFTPVCKTNQLEDCTKEEISNAYDNAIIYTDAFLSKTIHYLQRYTNTYDTAMFYLADHGESLGENGIYLHGMPYFIAPQAQKHTAALMWFGENFSQQAMVQRVKKHKDEPYSQDNLFHTLLGLFQVKTTLYDPTLDVLHAP